MDSGSVGFRVEVAVLGLWFQGSGTLNRKASGLRQEFQPSMEAFCLGS